MLGPVYFLLCLLSKSIAFPKACFKPYAVSSLQWGQSEVQELTLRKGTALECAASCSGKELETCSSYQFDRVSRKCRQAGLTFYLPPEGMDSGKQINATCELPLAYPLPLPAISGYQSQTYVAPGQDVTMTCRADKRPYPITVSWIKNGGNTNSAQVDEGTLISNTLNVNNLQDANHGDVYGCQVESIYFSGPTISSDVEIWVMKLGTPQLDKSSLCNMGDWNALYSITCTSSGSHPPASFEWFKNGATFAPGVTSGSETSTLQVTLSDANSGAKYYCRAVSGTLIESTSHIFVFSDLNPAALRVKRTITEVSGGCQITDQINEPHKDLAGTTFASTSSVSGGMKPSLLQTWDQPCCGETEVIHGLKFWFGPGAPSPGVPQVYFGGSLNAVHVDHPLPMDVIGATIYHGSAVHGVYLKLKDGTVAGKGVKVNNMVSTEFPDNCHLSEVAGRSSSWIPYIELHWHCQ